MMDSLKCLWNTKTLIGASLIAFVEAVKYIILKWMVR
jgi:hypothetical protein